MCRQFCVSRNCTPPTAAEATCSRVTDNRCFDVDGIHYQILQQGDLNKQIAVLVGSRRLATHGNSVGELVDLASEIGGQHLWACYLAEVGVVVLAARHSAVDHLAG